MPLFYRRPTAAPQSSPQSSFGIVTLTHDSDLYNRMDAIKRRQYLGRPHIFVYNEPRDRSKHPTDLIYISGGQHPSGIPMMIEKFVYFLRNFLDTDPWAGCTHIVRANSSTYLNLPLLENYIANLPLTRCYSGSVLAWGEVVSGTCIIFSRDTAAALSRVYRLLAPFRRKWEDDVVIALAMRLIRTRPTDIPMARLGDGRIPGDHELEELLRTYPLIRIRNDSDRERVDLGIWEALDRVSQRLQAASARGMIPPPATING